MVQINTTDPVATFKTGNTEWSVRISHKRFSATAPGFSEVTGKTWEDMENSARVAASKAKVKVAVPYIHFNGINGPAISAVEKTATGINSGTGNVTYRDARGGTGQETDSYRRYGYYKPFSQEDLDAYISLQVSISQLRNKASDIERRYAFTGSLKDEVQRAIDAKHAELEAQS